MLSQASCWSSRIPQRHRTRTFTFEVEPPVTEILTYLLYMTRSHESSKRHGEVLGRTRLFCIPGIYFRQLEILAFQDLSAEMPFDGSASHSDTRSSPGCQSLDYFCWCLLDKQTGRVAILLLCPSTGRSTIETLLCTSNATTSSLGALTSVMIC